VRAISTTLDGKPELAVIDKPAILITSLGRTGTEFFARLFAQAIPNATSLHEPDIFQNTGVENRLSAYLRQVRRAGIWRMVILKAFGGWTLVRLSDARFAGKLNAQAALTQFVGQRRAFIRRMPGDVYVEANIGYYGLLDITPRAFADHRALFFIRDGREWVRSHMNWGEAYNKRGLRKVISHNWPSPGKALGDPYHAEWPKFSRFERLCWAWTRLNEFALSTLARNPMVRVVRFEDVFAGEQRERNLSGAIDFATAHLGDSKARISSMSGQLEHRTHASSGDFPAWQDWTTQQRRSFERLCGLLMERLGYGLD
jgi:hypothetical protein